MNTNEYLFLVAAIWTGCDRALAGTETSSPPASLSKGASSGVPAFTAHDATQAARVVDFWRSAGPSLWFAKDPAFDQRFRETFADVHEAAARAELGHWMSSPEGALGLILLLDQYPRNSFRSTPRMYGTDELARKIAAAAISAGHDRAIEAPLRLFFYLPFGHSESLIDRSARWSYAGRSGNRRCRAPSITATSFDASGAFRTATRSWDAPRGPRRLASWPRVASPVDARPQATEQT